MKKTSYSIRLLLLVIISFASITANAVTATQELAGILKTYATVKGNFTQTLVDNQGELIQDSSGIFTVKAPGYFNWETKQPFPQLLVADLNTIWLYDPDLEQVTLTPYSDNVDQSPALLLSGNVEQIRENYTVIKADGVADSFILRPKRADSNFTELHLAFADTVLLSMKLKDTLDQTTTFTFSEVKINRSVNDALFIFEPPEGVDVLTNE